MYTYLNLADSISIQAVWREYRDCQKKSGRIRDASVVGNHAADHIKKEGV